MRLDSNKGGNAGYCGLTERHTRKDLRQDGPSIGVGLDNVELLRRRPPVGHQTTEQGLTHLPATNHLQSRPHADEPRGRWQGFSGG